MTYEQLIENLENTPMHIPLTDMQQLVAIAIIAFIFVLLVFFLDKLVFRKPHTNFTYYLIQSFIYIPLLIAYVLITYQFAKVDAVIPFYQASLSDKQRSNVLPTELAAWEREMIPQYVETLPTQRVSLKKAKLKQIDKITYTVIPRELPDNPFTIETETLTFKTFKETLGDSVLYYRVIPSTITENYPKDMYIGTKVVRKVLPNK